MVAITNFILIIVVLIQFILCFHIHSVIISTSEISLGAQHSTDQDNIGWSSQGSHMALPLSCPSSTNLLTGKSTLQWTLLCQEALDGTKALMIEDVLICNPNHNHPCLMFSNAFDHLLFCNKMLLWLFIFANFLFPTILQQI